MSTPGPEAILRALFGDALTITGGDGANWFVRIDGRLLTERRTRRDALNIALDKVCQTVRRHAL